MFEIISHGLSILSVNLWWQLTRTESVKLKNETDFFFHNRLDYNFKYILKRQKKYARVQQNPRGGKTLMEFRRVDRTWDRQHDDEYCASTVTQKCKQSFRFVFTVRQGIQCYLRSPAWREVAECNVAGNSNVNEQARVCACVQSHGYAVMRHDPSTHAIVIRNNSAVFRGYDRRRSSDKFQIPSEEKRSIGLTTTLISFLFLFSPEDTLMGCKLCSLITFSDSIDQDQYVNSILNFSLFSIAFPNVTKRFPITLSKNGVVNVR